MLSKQCTHRIVGSLVQLSCNKNQKKGEVYKNVE